MRRKTSIPIVPDRSARRILRESPAAYGLLNVMWQYASENLITNTVATGIFTLPSYTILNASVFYSVGAYRLAVKVDNLANKEYFGGWTTVEKQMSRRLAVSAGFKF